MKTKKIKNLTKKARAELSWKVHDVRQETGTIRILSVPDEKTHYIFLPPETAAPNPLLEQLYLHELGHALLCERHHPFLASVYPVAGLEERLGPAVRPLLNVAGDWFVGHWMMEFCRDLAMSDLHNEFQATTQFLNRSEPPSVEKFFVIALIIAQAIKYLNVADNCAGFLEQTVRTLLEVPPENPSAEKIVRLINGLLELGAPLRCRKTNCDGRDVLEFYPLDAADNGQAAASDSGLAD